MFSFAVYYACGHLCLCVSLCEGMQKCVGGVLGSLEVVEGSQLSYLIHVWVPSLQS